jgi:hypothetical protein
VRGRGLAGRAHRGDDVGGGVGDGSAGGSVDDDQCVGGAVRELFGAGVVVVRIRDGVCGDDEYVDVYAHDHVHIHDHVHVQLFGDNDVHVE